MTQRDETDKILRLLEDQHDQRASEIAELRVDIQALTEQVKETNGKVQVLERWQQYMQGVADTLDNVKHAKAWRFPAVTAFMSALVAVVVSVILQAVFG